MTTACAGPGSQYTVASGFVLTGLYYNKDVAEQVGIGEPPTTVAELEEDLAAAKDAGVTPIMAGNQTGQIVFTVQSMMNNTVGVAADQRLGLQRPRRQHRHPRGASRRSRPSPAGPSRATSTRTPTAPTPPERSDASSKGESLFFFSGSWDATALQDQMGDKRRVRARPRCRDRERALGHVGPGVELRHPREADQKDAAAAFLNFLLSPEARQIVVDTGAGPSGTGEPPTTEAGTLKSEVQEALRRARRGRRPGPVRAERHQRHQRRLARPDPAAGRGPGRADGLPRQHPGRATRKSSSEHARLDPRG